VKYIIFKALLTTGHEINQSTGESVLCERNEIMFQALENCEIYNFLSIIHFTTQYSPFDRGIGTYKRNVNNVSSIKKP